MTFGFKGEVESQYRGKVAALEHCGRGVDALVRDREGTKAGAVTSEHRLAVANAAR